MTPHLPRRPLRRHPCRGGLAAAVVIESGLVAVGGATFAGLGLAADPETARRPKVEAGEEVPT